MPLVKLDTKSLADLAHQLRIDVIEMLQAAKSGHPAGALGLAEIFSTLYFNVMNHNPSNPDWDGRDVLFLSNGHVAPILYASLARAGYFEVAELKTLRQIGSRLQGHPERLKLPGVENTSGPLGSGLSQAVGYAYSLQYLDGDLDRYVYCVASDGELDEGNIWEAALSAGKYQLGKLILIIDRNQIQLSGKTEKIMPLERLVQKWQAFNWHVETINGHSVTEIIEAIYQSKNISNQPSVIIAETVPGKGVDFMEDDYRWHGQVPDDEQAQRAIAQLSSQIKDEVVL